MARARAMRTGSNSTDVAVEKDGNLARAAASALGSIRGGVDMGDLRECWRIGLQFEAIIRAREGESPRGEPQNPQKHGARNRRKTPEYRHTRGRNAGRKNDYEAAATVSSAVA